ncbi:MAG: carbon-nitrogen hydrolase family protein [Bacteroidota bacterium]
MESRRNFIRKSALGIGGVTATGIAAKGVAPAEENLQSGHTPREVWIATISQHEIGAKDSGEMVSRLLGIMDEIVPLKPDIICLPELFAFSNIGKRPPLKESAEKPVGPVIAPFSDFAQKHSCYIICPTYTEEDGTYYNAAVLLNRKGDPAGQYRKMFPTTGEMERGISPGAAEPPVFETDFGKIGIQICFDSEWIDGWSRLQRAGAEIVFWPSAFSGGEKLNSFARLFNYYLVSSTRKDSSRIIDVTGADMASTGRWEPNWICAPVNLAKVVIPSWPYHIHFKKIETRYGRDVCITTLHNEEISIIESLSADLRVEDILEEFEIRSRRDYLQEAEEMHDYHEIKPE